MVIVQKLTKVHVDSNESEESPKVPPRPPKPAHINQSPFSSSDYFNISARSTLPKTSKDSANSEDVCSLHVTSDEMYDFPRSHQVEADVSQFSTMRRHCYNNAAPAVTQDGVFKYDTSPKAGTSNHVSR